MGESVGSRYSVVLQGLACTPEAFKAGLAAVGMRPETAERVVATMPCVLKKNLLLEEAQRYEQVFRGAGGQVAVEIELELEAPTPLPRATPAPELAPPPSAATTAAAAAPAVAARPVFVPIQTPTGDFRDWNPWVGRSVRIAILLAAVLGVGSCVSKYKVASRQSAFSRRMDADLQNLLVRVSHAGPANADDLRDVVERIARDTGVRVEITALIEKELPTMDLEEGGPLMMGYPGGCPPIAMSALSAYPMEVRLKYVELARSCESPAWMVGFQARVRARWLISSSTIVVEHYAFLREYLPEASPE